MTARTKTPFQFEPWVGDRYGASGSFGKRVLLLGESHYEWSDDEKPDPGWTRRAIKNAIEGKKHKFRTRVAATLLGHRAKTREERDDFWHSVAFINYIPESVGKGASADPTEEMWEAAVPRFAELIESLTPDALVVFGHELWRRIHYTFEMNGRPEPHPNAKNQWRVWRYLYPNGRKMLACATTHPSSRGFDSADWHPFVKAMLKAA